jgi:hypothetical protein
MNEILRLIREMCADEERAAASFPRPVARPVAPSAQIIDFNKARSSRSPSPISIQGRADRADSNG